MEYKEMIAEIRKLDYIKDDATADAAIKAVLGILVSNLDMQKAGEFLEDMPKPLTMEKMRGRRQRPLKISTAEYVREVSEQFNLPEAQSCELVSKVLHMAKDFLDPETVEDMEASLPPGMERDAGKSLDVGRFAKPLIYVILTSILRI